MMDYYSNFPAPPVVQVIKDVSQELYRDISKQHIKPSVMRKNILIALDRIGGHSNLGSLTGYALFGKKDLIHKSSLVLAEERLKCLTFKTLATTVYTLVCLHNEVIHNRYKPGGEGYHEADMDFHHTAVESHLSSYLDESLPPIDMHKPLYRPIKDGYLV